MQLLMSQALLNQILFSVKNYNKNLRKQVVQL